MPNTSKTRSTKTKKNPVRPLDVFNDAPTPRYLKVIIWTAVILFVFNLVTGIISYGVMTVWCLRPPVVATKFAADYHYYVPGQQGTASTAS